MEVIRGHLGCPLSGGCPLFGGSAIGGSTAYFFAGTNYSYSIYDFSSHNLSVNNVIIIAITAALRKQQ